MIASNPPVPPKADRRPLAVTAHGLTWADDYAWIRAENWREVLAAPEALPPDIRALLEAENAYAEAMLAPTQALQDELKREMRARLKEDDSEPPAPDGPYAYYSRFRPGGQHRLYCRSARGGGEETVLLDGDERAEGHGYFHFDGARHSPDHGKLAWSADDKGSEMSAIRVRDIVAGADLPDLVESTTGDIVWTRDSDAFLYVLQDENHRPCRVMLHRLGSAADVLVFEETDPAWFVGLASSRLGRRAFIQVHGHDASESWVVDLAAPEAPPRRIAPRRPGFRYEALDRGDMFFIKTNQDGAKDFKIVTAPSDAPDEANWRDFVPTKPGRLIEDVSLYRNHLVWLAREDNLPRLVIHGFASDDSHEIAFAARTYSLGIERSLEFETNIFRFSFSSMACSHETYDYDMATRERVLVKKQKTPDGFDGADYTVEMLGARADDGEIVPISVLRRADTPINASAPMLIYGYGAYGITMDASFSSNRFSLVDRGFVFAIAHVRGGSDKGFGWYEDGKLEKKKNTFSDFLAATRHMVASGYAHPDRVIAQGGSAGGLLMGVIANEAPELFAGIVADVPFVDALNTILDETLPLTPPEWLEWGDPIRSEAAFAAIRAYSPYENIEPQAYPAILALAGLADPRVTYWEPTKWVAKLRATMSGGGPVLLRTAMGGGHSGAPGRFDRLGEVARVYAFAIHVAEGGFATEET